MFRIIHLVGRENTKTQWNGSKGTLNLVGVLSSLCGAELEKVAEAVGALEQEKCTPFVEHIGHEVSGPPDEFLDLAVVLCLETNKLCLEKSFFLPRLIFPKLFLIKFLLWMFFRNDAPTLLKFLHIK